MSVEKVLRATSTEDVVRLLGEHKAEAQIIAGGTDLLVQIREKKNRASILIDITDVKGLGQIIISDEKISIGAMVRFTDLVENQDIKDLFLGLWDACKSVGSPQIRNLGTLAGNLANGSPAADSAPPLLALDARVIAASTGGERLIKLSDFYLGKGKTVLQENEYLKSIEIPIQENKGSYVEFEKLGLRNALAISRISAAVQMNMDGSGRIKSCRIASGSLGLCPMREQELETWLTGKALNASLIAQGAQKFGQIVEERLAGRSSMPYKKGAVQGVIKPALERILKRSQGLNVEG